MAILKKYQLTGPKMAYDLVKKAFVDDEDWISKEVMDELKEAAAKVDIYDIEESPIGGWDYEPHGEKIPAWSVGFHCHDSRIAEQQKEQISKEEDEGKESSFDSDELGMAFVYFYFNMRTGRLYKIESESVQ